MKKNLFALFIALLSVGQVFGGGGGSSAYYVTGTAKISTKSTGSGTVYVSGEKTATSGDTTCNIDAGGKQTNKDVYFFAIPDVASEFEGWYDEEGELLTNVATYSRKIKSSTGTGEDKTNERTFTAKFRKKAVACEITFAPSTDGGTYSCKYLNNTPVDITTEQPVSIEAQRLILNATPESGKRLLGWWTMISGEKKYLSTRNPDTLSFVTNQTIGCDFVEESLPTFAIKSELDGPVPITLYTSLSKAISVAHTNSKNSEGTNKIVALVTDGTLNENVTIPSDVILLIPFSDNYDCYKEFPLYLCGWKRQDASGGYLPATCNKDMSQEFRRLTIGANKTLTIEGALSVSAPRWVAFWNTEREGSVRINGKYGCVNMEQNSKIVVNSQGNLYCWGRIIGTGNITVNSGATVYESFVYTDYRHDDKLKSLVGSSFKQFAINQYFIQDIQVPITYYYGSKGILAAAAWYVSYAYPGTGTMKFVDTEGSLFQIKNDTSSITKYYTLNEDRLNYDFYGETGIGDFSLSILSSYSFSTSKKIFTATHNWTFNVLSGKCKISIDMSLAPGAHLNIEKGAEVEVQSTYSLYACDAADWGKFAPGNKIIPLFLPKNFTGKAPYTYKNIKSGRTYSAFRDADHMGVAEIKVDGTLTTLGGKNKVQNTTSGLYTTNAGAKIYSTVEGGKIVYANGKGAQTAIPYTLGCGDKDSSQTSYNVSITPAQLKNGNGSYTSTSAASEKSTFKYFGTGTDGEWKQAWKVTFKNDGVEFASAYYAEGDVITSPTEQPQKEGYRFKGWGDVADTMGKGDLEYEAQWEQIVVATTIEVTPTTVITDKSETTIDESTYVIKEQMQAEVVKVDEGAAIEIAENASVETQTLALSTTPSAINLPDEGQSAIGTSSQIKGKGAINAQNVFIDITMDTSGTLDASKYYAFAVPFAVKVDGGVQQFNDNEWVDCKHDTHYRAYTYDGAKRADNGKGSNWTLVDNKGTFQPGVFYLVEFAPGMGNVYRFTKATEGNLNNAANINLEAFAGTNTADKGWNGIANNALQNASISVSNTDVAQIFDPTQNAFVTVGLEGTQFAIGTPLFVQVENDATATNSAVAQPASVPARMLAQPQTETLGNYIVRIAAENADKMADQLFISASEDAENNYVIGKDLVKMFMGNATTAQLWVNNYDKKLSMHQALLTNGSAEASLTLYAPKAGNYRIYLKEAPEDATIYLMENGYVVANLNDDAYYVALTKGENSLYGLRINAKTKSDVTTSINDVKATSPVQKVLFQNKVYIVRNGRLFDIFGQTVK